MEGAARVSLQVGRRAEDALYVASSSEARAYGIGIYLPLQAALTERGRAVW